MAVAEPPYQQRAPTMRVPHLGQLLFAQGTPLVWGSVYPHLGHTLNSFFFGILFTYLSWCDWKLAGVVYRMCLPEGMVPLVTVREKRKPPP